MHAPLALALSVEWQPLSALAAHAPEWRALAARALEPNVFYEPAFALNAGPVLGPDVNVALVWSNAPRRQLLGLFPYRVDRRRFGMPWPVATGWTHPFAPLGAPLVDRDAAVAVITAWLTAMQNDPALPAVMLLPYLPEDGAMAAAFDEALARCGSREARFGAHARALLAPAADRQSYLDRALSGRRHKELHRQARRLDERGAVAVATARDPGPVAAALQDFLALEASGWKGRAGSAALTDPAIREFMQAAVAGLAAEGKASVHRLCSGGRPVAAGIVLYSADRAWFWKIAHDDTLARFSPGVILTLELSDALLANRSVACVDSCATPDHPMIDRIWRERRALADRLILVRPEARLSFALACRLETWRRRGLAVAKGLRAKWRPRQGLFG